MQKYAKLCKTMQNYAKTFLKFKKFEISLENNPQITTRFFRWSDFVHNIPFLISLSYLHNFRKHCIYCGRVFSLVHLTEGFLAYLLLTKTCFSGWSSTYVFDITIQGQKSLHNAWNASSHSCLLNSLPNTHCNPVSGNNPAHMRS